MSHASKPPSQPVEPAIVTPAEARRRTRRAFIGFGLAGAFGGGAWAWLATRSDLDNIPWPLRRAHEANEALSRTVFDPGKLGPEFPRSRAAEPRPNGSHGMPDRFANDWSVAVSWAGGAEQRLDRKELFDGVERVESTIEFKCIEGWSQIVTWGGYRFVDVAAKRGWPVEKFANASMTTVDGSYYVGLDMPSLLHPQSLLCDAMNGEPLPFNHGGPVRLTMPVKYGIKSIKWLGRIELRNDRPADYWAKRGYDWFSGH